MSEQTTSPSVHKEHRSWQWRYGVGILSVALATVLRLGLIPFIQLEHPFSTFYLAVTVTAWFAGFGPSLMATVLGYGLADWFFIPPLRTIGPHWEDPVPLTIYFLVTFTICVFAKTMHDANQRAKEKQELLEEEIEERNRIEHELLKAQQQLKRHAAELEDRVSERTAKLRETVESLEGFCYSIAHDLRAPLRAMQGYATMLREEVPGAGKEYTQRIINASMRMDQLVRDLLTYGRLSHQEMKPTVVDLEMQVNWVLKSLSEEICGQQAVVNVQRPLPKVLSNDIILRQVLTNLLTNALKFVQPDLPPIIKIYAQGGERVRLCVEDNGIGIDARYHERIFKVFERLHAVEAYSGTGIGLAIVKKGVEKMGGNVGVKSKLGQGSCFWIELPAVT